MFRVKYLTSQVGLKLFFYFEFVDKIHLDLSKFYLMKLFAI